MESSVRRIRKPVQREDAEQYLVFILLSFAASVILIRLFLELTGYPQVGNSELHIAHVLWGGLLLFVASLLPLVLANHWVYKVGALLAGVGVGLFIDEVGKFITQSNNYFYPAAAPIIYAFFLLTVLVYLQVRRSRPRDARVELYHALDRFQEVLDHDLNTQERADLETRLSRVDREATYPDIARLANALRGFLASEKLYLAPDSPNLWERWSQRGQAYEARWLTRRRLKVAVVGGLVVLGLLALSNLTVDVLVDSGAQPVEVQVASVVEGPAWFLVRVALEGLVGLLLLVAAAVMILGRERLGSVLGYFGLLLALTTVNLLAFYFDQFGAVISAMMQFVLLLGVILYRRRYLISASGNHNPLPDNHN